MSQIEDAYPNGVQVGIHCPRCVQTVFTPVMELEIIAIDIALDWEKWHDVKTGHGLSRLEIHYYA